MSEPPHPTEFPRKAMVLAAGLGTRLLPLTQFVPKPMLPVASVPLIRYALRLLASAGCQEVMVNLHHLPEQIEEEVGRKAEGLKIQYSHEATILGTGGGLRKVAGFFDQTFFLLNADSIIDLDLAAALATHRAHDALATMVLRSRVKGDTYTVIGVDDAGLVRQIGERVKYQGPDLHPYLFTGVHVLEPEFLDYIPPDIESCINGYAYPKVIEDGRTVAAHIQEGYWADVGTLERYWQTNVDLLTRRAQLSFFDPLASFAHGPSKDVDTVIRLGEKCSLGTSVRLDPPVLLGDGVRVGDEVAVGPEVVVGAGCILGKNCRVRRAILLPGARIEPGEVVDSEVVTRKIRVPFGTRSEAADAPHPPATARPISR
ncbi:MAG: NDP-sugar synthase [Pseudomonadota bacterium]